MPDEKPAPGSDGVRVAPVPMI